MLNLEYPGVSVHSIRDHNRIIHCYAIMSNFGVIIAAAQSGAFSCCFRQGHIVPSGTLHGPCVPICMLVDGEIDTSAAFAKRSVIQIL